MEKKDIVKLLEEGNVIQIEPIGYSMYPMFIPGRDYAIIEPIRGKKLKRGDVVLYRRKNSILVLHRLWKCKRDGLYMVGDNQTRVEGPLEEEQVIGKLHSFIRNERRISVNQPVYVAVSRLWLFLRPCRNSIRKIVTFIKKLM